MKEAMNQPQTTKTLDSSAARAAGAEKQHSANPYVWSVIALGAAACLFSAARLPVAGLDARFLLLALITVTVGSRLSVQIPHVSGRITVADTFIFLTMLLYGGEAAVLLAAAEGACATLRISRRPVTISLNAAVLGGSTFLTALTLRLCFGDVGRLAEGGYTSASIVAVCVMALVQYVTNSGLIAGAQAYKIGRPVWQTWKEYYLWTSVTYFAGASSAGIIAKLVHAAGFHALLVTTPIIAIVFFTYKTYLKNVEASVAQAEQAERHVEELSRYIAEQERIREQYAQIEKLSALGELASGVAHDFNNTLAGILGRVQLLQRTKDPEKIERGLQLIRKVAEDGAKTVKRIQDFARQRRDHDFERIHVDQLLFDVREITRPRWKDSAEASGVRVSLQLQILSNSVVMGDASELREVLVNMIFNSLDAMPRGGRIMLSAEEEGDAVVISVSDTGEGMTEEARSRVFDPFFTTKGKAGMGLGLAVSYGIIRRHEGRVEVESQLGRGTTFRIRLPLAERQVKAAGRDLTARAERPGQLPAPAWPLPQERGRVRLLVVDDEAAVRELLRDILEAEGYQVSVACGGREALELFEAERFDGVFTDIGMPGMNGWELARAVRELSPTMPLAVITGWGDVVGSDEQAAAQVDWVVTKPFTAERIAELARGVCRRRVEVGAAGVGPEEARAAAPYGARALAAVSALGSAYSPN